ncbi:MAG: hypothetical protein M5U31_02530 [Acidimicrobiia bacterium]|nr:hypothetical protein [Acidimicrobiia bacterium]
MESWHVDFSRDDGVGGFVQLGRRPCRSTAYFWGWLVGPGIGHVVVRDDETPPPSDSALEIRAGGLWAELTCETPFEHWGVGLEALGVRLDEPGDVFRGERGERVAVGLDLDWEADGDVFSYPEPGDGSAGHDQQPGTVQGEILLDDERIAFSGRGERDHSFGPRDWWSTPWHWAAWQTPDGHATSVLSYGGDSFVTGYLSDPRDETHVVEALRVESHTDAEGFPTAARYVVNHDTEIDVEVLSLTATPVVADDGRTSRYLRALCRFLGDGTGGTGGTGWAEWLVPPR